MTPGDSLGTRARAREWTEEDALDDSEMSVEEEEEDSAAENSEVEKMAGATRAQWVKHDVALLREADLGGLTKHNAALYRNVFGNTVHPRGSACLSILPQEQSAAGVERFANRRMVRALLRRLPYVEKEQFVSTLTSGKPVHSLVLRFTSQSEARAARDRILEEHRGGAWPPPFLEAPSVLDHPTTRGVLLRASTRGRMASLAQPPLGESSSAYQGALYTLGLTGYGGKTPAHEAGPFLPATPFPGGMRQ